MILQGKKILVMGVRNKWSIAWGAIQSAYNQGAEVICTCSESSRPKVEELVSKLDGVKIYTCGDVSLDQNIEDCLKEIKKDHDKIDGILHSIAHANTEDLRNDFVLTSKEGYAHACDVSSYSFVAVARIAKELNLLNENASLVALSYYGAEKAVEGYNVMGVAKAALEASIKYMAMNLGKDGYRVNGISAGPVKTLSAKGIKDFSTILDLVEKRAPLHKNITINQVGDTAAFLFSSMSSGITGEILHVDNGFSIVGV